MEIVAYDEVIPSLHLRDMQLHEHHAVPIRKGPPRPQDALAPFVASASSFDMTSEDEIGDALTLLAASGDAISMYAPGSREPVLGRILSVDPELPHFVMELNEGSVLQPGKVTFVSWLRTAKLQFRLASQEWRSVPGKPHLIPMTFPEACTVLNRRASERVETPLGTTLMASFELIKHTYELPIYDLSLGGVGLRCSKLQAKGLFKGRKIPGVVLELGPEIEIATELEIRFTRSLRSFLLGEQLHLGCRFVNMSQEAAAQLAEQIALISGSGK